jgi:hypothetical protein
MEEYPIKIGIDYDEKASRLEALVIRWLYGIFLAIAVEIWGFFAVLAMIAQCFFVLIKGKRHQGLHSFIESFFRFFARVYGYLMLLTDVRPPLSGRAT